MKNIFINLIVIIMTGALTSCNSGDQHKKDEDGTKEKNTKVIRVGQVIKMDSTRLKDYLAVHSDSHDGVRDLLQKYHINNFSIFMTKLDDGYYYEFAYYEYTGDNYEADMSSLAAEPRNIEWLKMTDSMQIPLNGQTSWKKMEQIFYNK